MTRLIAALPLLLILTACSRHDAPSDQLAESAKQLVGSKQPEPATLATGRFAPRDTCGDLPDADEFRGRLAEAIQAHDTEAFVALAAADIKLDTAAGGASGIDELRRRLAVGDGALWNRLGDLLTLGCSANDKGGMTIPWYADQHIDAPDPAHAMLVTGEKVALRAAPGPAGQPLETISWDLVEIGMFTPGLTYQLATSADGKRGYIATEKLRSMVAYRLVAMRRNGKWSIVSFVAGG
jgi:hypothetical protein